MASVLIVDDEADICFAVARHLQRSGHAVQTMSDGAAALAAIAGGARPDVILLDVYMPGLDGESFVRALHQHVGVHPPVILMTGAADAARRAREVGAAGWLEKPFLLDDVTAAVDRALGIETAAPWVH
jgi:CheY-like chemotaxis protein